MKAWLTGLPVDSDEMNEQAERVLDLLRARGLKDREIRRALSDACGITYQSVQQWFTGASKSIQAQHLATIAKTWGANLDWLVTGRGQRDVKGSNVEPGPRLRGLVPVISWVAAGSWDEAADPYAPGDGQNWKACPVSHSGRTYALRVRGDSMTAPHGKSYPDGCLIFVDPERRVPEHGQPVIAKINGDAEVTFKLFMRDAGRVWLRALNPAYPPITDEFAVLGSVIGKWEDA